MDTRVRSQVRPVHGTGLATLERFDWRGRVRAELPLKIGLSVGLTAGFCLFYFGLQRFTLFPVRQVPVTGVDRLVAFDPRWVWAYQSIYLLMPILPWLARRRRQLTQYARGFVWLSAVSFAVFLLLPVESPRPAVLPDHAGYRLLAGVDGTLNAFPSLHAGLTVYTFLFGLRMLRREGSHRARTVLIVVAIAWTCLILYATLATKQHWFVDLPAGMFLAWAAHVASWRCSARPTVVLADTFESKEEG